MTLPKVSSAAPGLTALILLGLVSLFSIHSARAQDSATLIDLEGHAVEDDLAQGDVIVVLWASWSPRCRDIGLRLTPLIDRWAGRAKIVSLVFREDPETVRRFLERGSPGTGPADRILKRTWIDAHGAFAKSHGLSTLPSLLVLRDGQPAFRGQLPTDPHAVIEDALAPVPEAAPRSFPGTEMR